MTGYILTFIDITKQNDGVFYDQETVLFTQNHELTSAKHDI